MGQKNIDNSFTSVVHACYFVEKKIQSIHTHYIIDDTVYLNADFIPGCQFFSF